MSYTAEISRTHPSCFVFLIDQSGSMQEGWAGEAGKNKAEGLSTIINRLLQNLVLKCAKSGGVRDRSCSSTFMCLQRLHLRSNLLPRPVEREKDSKTASAQ